MYPPIRPTPKELFSKLKDAREILSKQNGFFAVPGKVASELNAMKIGDSAEVWPLILELLKEIKPEHYTGGKPPQKSYEKSIEGRELFAFSWDSKHLGKKMYLKFVIRDGRFYYVSLHPDKPPSPERSPQ